MNMMMNYRLSKYEMYRNSVHYGGNIARMIVLIVVLTSMLFLLGAIITLCLCKESINWRDKKSGYDLEESIGVGEKRNIGKQN